MDALLLHQYVVIELGVEKYALKISDIHEIIKLQKITEVPNSKSYLEGVTNLRGKIVPIVSLRKRFGLDASGGIYSGKHSRIVVVEYAGEMVGIIVDRVNQVIRFADIQPSTDVASGVDGAYFEGIGHTEEGLISILHIEHILSGSEGRER